MRVLGISGSLRRDSYNTRLLQVAGEMVESRGIEFELYDALKQVPPYDEDDDRDLTPPAAAHLRAAVAGADAVLFSTPEYNHSIPGQLKNAVDWLSRPVAKGAVAGKPVAVIGASAGMFGAVWAQAELRKVLSASAARVVEGEVPVGHAHTRFDPDGTLNDDNLAEQVRAVLDDLIQAAGVAREQALAA
jgi:chromate reductase, NAD(P)H dehydrogenase (quinone)